MRIFNNFYLSILFLLNINGGLIAQNLRLESTINSISYYIENANNISDKVSFEVKFKESSALFWRSAIEPSSFRYTGGKKLITGSILQVKSNTNYNIEVNIIDSIPILHKVILTGITKTQSEPELDLNSTNVLYVSPQGKERKYSKEPPGSIDTLFNLDFSKISCGTTIICKGGTYHVGELKYNVNPAPCNAETHIIIASAPNEIAIFDGSDPSENATFPEWQLFDVVNNIYNTTLPQSTAFSALMLYELE